MPVKSSTLKKRANAHRPKTRSQTAKTKAKRQAAAAKARSVRAKKLKTIQEGGYLNRALRSPNNPNSNMPWMNKKTTNGMKNEHKKIPKKNHNNPNVGWIGEVHTRPGAPMF